MAMSVGLDKWKCENFSTSVEFLPVHGRNANTYRVCTTSWDIRSHWRVFDVAKGPVTIRFVAQLVEHTTAQMRVLRPWMRSNLTEMEEFSYLDKLYKVAITMSYRPVTERSEHLSACDIRSIPGHGQWQLFSWRQFLTGHFEGSW